MCVISFLLDAICFVLVVISVGVVSAASIKILRNFDRICRVVDKFEDVHAAITSFQRNGIAGVLLGTAASRGDNNNAESEERASDVVTTSAASGAEDADVDADELELI